LIDYDRIISLAEKKSVGLRVIVDGYPGFVATNNVSERSVRELVNRAVSVAKAMKLTGRRIILHERKACRDRISSKFKINPLDVDPREKIGIAMDAYKSGREVEDVVSVLTRLGIEHEHREFYSSWGR